MRRMRKYDKGGKRIIPTPDSSPKKDNIGKGVNPKASYMDFLSKKQKQEDRQYKATHPSQTFRPSHNQTLLEQQQNANRKTQLQEEFIDQSSGNFSLEDGRIIPNPNRQSFNQFFENVEKSPLGKAAEYTGYIDMLVGLGNTPINPFLRKPPIDPTAVVNFGYQPPLSIIDKAKASVLSKTDKQRFLAEKTVDDAFDYANRFMEDPEYLKRFQNMKSQTSSNLEDEQDIINHIRTKVLNDEMVSPDFSKERILKMTDKQLKDHFYDAYINNTSDIPYYNADKVEAYVNRTSPIPQQKSVQHLRKNINIDPFSEEKTGSYSAGRFKDPESIESEMVKVGSKNMGDLFNVTVHEALGHGKTYGNVSFTQKERDLLQSIFPSSSSASPYLKKPTEIMARMDEIRSVLNKDQPFKIITAKDLRRFESLVNKKDSSLAQFIKNADKDKLADAMNTMYAGTGLLTGSTLLNKDKMGGMKKYDEGGFTSLPKPQESKYLPRVPRKSPPIVEEESDLMLPGFFDDYYKQYNPLYSKFTKATKGTKDPYNYDDSIVLNTGKFRGAKVPKQLINDAYAAAKKAGVDPYDLLGLIGQESTFGGGEGESANRRHSKTALASAFRLADKYEPRDPLGYLADQKVPGIKVTPTSGGYSYTFEDQKKAEDYVASHPELLKQYTSRLSQTQIPDNYDSFYEVASHIKKKGLQGYNPGDKNYVNDVTQAKKLLQQDPSLKQYIQSGNFRKGGYKRDLSFEIPPFEHGGNTFSGTPFNEQKPDENDPWINSILNYEAAHGSAKGTGLSNFGYNSRNPKDINQARDFFKQDYLPKVQQYPLPIRSRLADYSYNTGRSLEDLQLYAAGKISLNDINSPKTFDTEWMQNQGEIQGMYNNPDFVNKLDSARDNIYRTTKQINGQPNPAYTNTWKGRIENLQNVPASFQSSFNYTPQNPIISPINASDDSNFQFDINKLGNFTPDYVPPPNEEVAPNPIINQSTSNFTQPTGTQDDSKSFKFNPAQIASTMRLMRTVGTGISNTVAKNREEQSLLRNEDRRKFDNIQQIGLDNKQDSNLYGYRMRKGGIHIKPSHKGLFTEYADNKGMGVQEAAHWVMSNSEDPVLRKRANFAIQASKWKHNKGGKLYNYAEGGLSQRDRDLWNFIDEEDDFEDNTSQYTNTAPSEAEVQENIQEEVGQSEDEYNAMIHSILDYSNQNPDSEMEEGDTAYSIPRSFIQPNSFYTPPEESIPQVTSPQPSSSQPYSTPKVAPKGGTDKMRYAFNYLQEKGLAPHIAAGIIGNAMQESTMDPLALGDKDKDTGDYNSRGLFQWSKKRYSKFLDWANKNNLDRTNMETQLDYFIEESDQMGLLNKLKKTKSVKEATELIRDRFEIPAVKDNRRLEYAYELLNEIPNNKSISKVNTKDLVPNLTNVLSSLSTTFPGIVVTSGKDSQHMKGSRHYTGRAIDIGAKSSDKAAYNNMKQFLKSPAGQQFKKQNGIEDIIDEGNHIHIELPKGQLGGNFSFKQGGYKLGQEIELTDEEYLDLINQGYKLTTL